jgi:hypothetical protein
MRRTLARQADVGRICCALALLLFGGCNAFAGDMQISLRWPGKTYVWHYNPQHKPDWLSEEEALSVVRKAAAGWEACGVSLPYAGLTAKSPSTIDGENVVGWREDGKNFSAWTTWAAHRDGRAIEADVSLYTNVFDLYRRQGIDARLELHKSLVHEFGHIVGLSHSDRPEDAMSVKVKTRPEWKQPSDNDIARCRALYP